MPSNKTLKKKGTRKNYALFLSQVEYFIKPFPKGLTYKKISAKEREEAIINEKLYV